MIHLFFSFLFLVHPIYISSTNVVINDDKLEVKVKLFRDDLEDGLRDFHGFSISIDSPNKIEKNQNLINEYINDKLTLIVNNEKIGYFKNKLKVYGKENQSCPRCKSLAKIQRIKQSGRSTFLCTKCQN